ncbi:hypothetical protein [uncultured Meiothermus sp.]|jgi:tetratricopeptide (TPR) repeat protein|uniref:hypothetical protein n=1 Tax=uncultured Meiothermus sp. TaxID=157471 RepID=UPI0026399699|nr:hypothetical protein [uncultured Meiothermus sp.]
MSTITLERLSLPHQWDALSAEPSLGLLASLQALPALPLREARRAYVLLMLGRLDEAQKLLDGAEPYPLLQAVQMAIWVEQHHFARVLEAAPQKLEGLPVPLLLEAQARAWLEQSKARFHLCQYREAWKLVRQAADQARTLRMSSLALVCELHAEECRTALDETGLDLSHYEQMLRLQADTAPSQESRVMAYMALVRLLSRQGLYDKAMRFTLEVPRPLNGQHFVELMLVLNRLDDESDWGKLEPRYQGRLHAIKGLVGLDAAFILSGPPPDPSFHPRPYAEWNIAFGWARLSQGEYAAALEYFQAAFVPRCEWDLRLVRGMGLVELCLLSPEAMAEYDLEPLIQETQALLIGRISPQSLILRLIPRGMPHATTLLLTLPKPCVALHESAQSQLLLVNPAGLSIAGVTHANTSALVKLLEGDTEGMTPGALRTNRHRLNLFLQQFGQPTVVRGRVVWAAIQRLAHSAEDAALWREVRDRYARGFSYAE